jgi:hypothetical protein
MADQGEKQYWGNKHKPFVPAWTNEDELAALADAIVRGASVCHAIVPNLRTLIEAVQAHPETCLADVGHDGNPIDGATELRLHGGKVINCNCRAMTIAIRLIASVRFVGDADFGVAMFRGNISFKSTTFTGVANFAKVAFIGAASFESTTFTNAASFSKVTFSRSAYFWRVTFGGVADFSEATFTSTAYFRQATFAGAADFSKGTFSGTASFWQATFTKHVLFWQASFTCDTTFSKATFTRVACFWKAAFARDADFSQSIFTCSARFWEATFSHDANFWQATFTGNAEFGSITLDRRLLLADAIFEPSARLSFEGAYLRSGSVITLARSHIVPERHYDHEHTPWWWLRSVYGDFIPCTRPPLSKLLGINAGGSIIEGEDSDHAEALLSAASDYNRLRDNFRHQSNSELEDLCHFRYMDLRRRAGDLWKQAGPISKRTHKSSNLMSLFRPIQWLFMDGILYWLIWRNCLGYLVRPIRPLVTAILVILLGSVIYALGVSNDTIHYHGTLADDQTVMDIWNGTALTPLYFSLTSFMTLSYGGFAPTGWLRIVVGIQALFGVSLIVLFTLSWGRKMIR